MLAQKEIIKENLQFILSHFNGQEYKFPRAIMTLKSKGQIYSNNEEEMFQHFLESDFKGCKINGYPFFEKGDNVNKLSPSFLFIELDLSLCNVCKYPKRKLDYILKQTLSKIEKETHGNPTVLWTGEGYHIYLPIILSSSKDNEKHPSEFVDLCNEFTPYVDSDLTTEFMRFAAKYFTNCHQQKGTKQNSSASVTSCFITVPETISIKDNFKVKIIQKWDGNVTSVNSIAPCFLDNLTQRRSKHKAIDK
ncbi:MAG TPA: hypothetical protein VER14_03440 [Phototrophicaceae bacterium]|nr:hypothetical protein [Phototrophicaceae bacterium]